MMLSRAQVNHARIHNQHPLGLQKTSAKDFINIIEVLLVDDILGNGATTLALQNLCDQELGLKGKVCVKL